MSHFDREPKILEWDTNHFGAKIACFGPTMEDDVQESLKWARSQSVEMLIARCDTTNVNVTHALVGSKFVLMDTYVRYNFDFSKKSIPEDTGTIPIRPFRPEDIPEIGMVANTSFRGYISHFHNDPRLPRDKCDSLYVGWAINSCREKRLADEVLVAEEGGRILGFATIKGLDKTSAEGILFGVDSSAQGRGIYRSFMIQSMHWCRDRGFKVMEVDSQVNNYAVQRVWVRLGFEIYTSGHTFHLWFDA